MENVRKGQPEDDGGADGKESTDIEQENEKGAGRDHGAADKPGAAEAEDDASGEESGKRDCEETAGGQTTEPGGTESQGEEIAPAQKFPEILEKEADPEEGTEAEFDAMNAPEVIEKPFGSRKDWLDTLTAYGMAVAMAEVMKTVSTEDLDSMRESSFWERWLNEEVDDHGQKIEEA